MLNANEALLPEQVVSSADGRFHLTFQQDGNLVLSMGSDPIWATDTAGTPIQALMQGDGNFVVTTSLGTWHTDTYDNPGAYLMVQSDGNVVVYSSGFLPLWASNTGGR